MRMPCAQCRTSGDEEEKPVLIFIHGGGFTYLPGTTPLYNGKHLAAKGIVVDDQYRLFTRFIPVMMDGKPLQTVRSVMRCKGAQEHFSFWRDARNITLMDSPPARCPFHAYDERGKLHILIS